MSKRQEKLSARKDSSGNKRAPSFPVLSFLFHGKCLPYKKTSATAVEEENSYRPNFSGSGYSSPNVSTVTEAIT